MTAVSFDRVVDALDRAGHFPPHLDGRPNGRLRMMVRCPAHDDRRPSLSVEHTDDRVLLHCFAGCETADVLEALNLGFSDLYDEPGNGRVPSATVPFPLRVLAPGTALQSAIGRDGVAVALRAPRTGFDPQKFRVLDVAKMVAEIPPPVPWEIEQLAVRRDVAVLTGDPGAGKSMLALALSAAKVRGESIAGIGCSEGTVVYLDAENGYGEIHRRLHSLGVPLEGVTVVEADGINLRDEDDFAGLGALVEHYGPALLVLDSLTALWPGANERKTEDVAPTLYALKRLAERQEVAILVLHHRPKDGGEYRGTTAIAAAAQLGFTLSKAKDDPDRTRRRLHCWKCRPSAEPEDRWLHLDAERGMVLVGVAQPHEDQDEPGRQAPARTALAPRFLAALGDDRLGLAEIAGRLGVSSKDGTLRRVAQHLEAGGEVVRDEDKKYSKCQVPSAIGPKGSGTVAPGTPLSRAETRTGTSRNSRSWQRLRSTDSSGSGATHDRLRAQMSQVRRGHDGACALLERTPSAQQFARAPGRAHRRTHRLRPAGRPHGRPAQAVHPNRRSGHARAERAGRRGNRRAPDRHESAVRL
jgi:hypothetical protein